MCMPAASRVGLVVRTSADYRLAEDAGVLPQLSKTSEKTPTNTDSTTTNSTSLPGISFAVLGPKKGCTTQSKWW